MHLQMVLPLSSNLPQPTAPHLATFSAHTRLHASPCAVLSAWKALPLLTHPFKSHCLTCSHELPARQNQSIQCSAPMYLADLYCSSSHITLASSTKQGLYPLSWDGKQIALQRASSDRLVVAAWSVLSRAGQTNTIVMGDTLI